jgi:hypothetical protein
MCIRVSWQQAHVSTWLTHTFGMHQLATQVQEVVVCTPVRTHVEAPGRGCDTLDVHVGPPRRQHGTVVRHHVLIAGVVAGVDEPVTGKGIACGGCKVVVVSMQEHTVAQLPQACSACVVCCTGNIGVGSPSHLLEVTSIILDATCVGSDASQPLTAAQPAGLQAQLQAYRSASPWPPSAAGSQSWPRTGPSSAPCRWQGPPGHSCPLCVASTRSSP